ncbi:acyl-CoA dehydrogenase family protein [Arthrobacter sp. AET 35A]|uniref:acyl-CoA dehydrogenase family protein n=1 Tax=Arthrobacter sp. AET 35A TaxID=2292643 RepID=UPI001781B807|nr:acyl-CoA dehydrogenase family protein [Arthrobacter sp. AET 35A]MBE0011156.1 acyl-CoA dehydrogenase [Arthrobacter sp. AET 35A]
MDTPADILPDSLLDTFRERAAGYDSRNEFFHADLADLREAGYLALMAAVDDGGRGLGIEAAAVCQRRLASAAPATALAINMHLVWTGVALLLQRRGDTSLDFVLREAAQGELYAFGLSEPGNDAVLFDSLTTAAPQTGGGYSFTGTKIFTSLAPAWTRLGVFGKTTTPDGAEQLVHGFVTRGTPGVHTAQDWDTLGMRASQSHTTRLDDVVIPAERIFRHLPVGPNADPLVFAIFAAFETLLSAVYTGIGDRSLALAIESANQRTTGKGLPLAQTPEVRWQVADAAMAMDSLDAQLQSVARDLDAGTDHGARWFAKLVGLKLRATGVAREVTDAALHLAGGQGFRTGSEIGRLHRDVLAGQYHPSSTESAHRTVATAWLGPLEDG